MATITTPVAVSQSVSPVAEDSGWRAGYWQQNAEPNVVNVGATDGSGNPIPLDDDPTKMWQGPNQIGANGAGSDAPAITSDGEPVDRIYFDVMPQQDPGNPLPQTEGTQPRQQFTQHQLAYIGFWRDCNGDGFVGSAITGTQSYDISQWREEAALNGFDQAESVCPVGERVGDMQAENLEGLSEDKVNKAVNFMFNDGTQVRELVPIGPHLRDTEGHPTYGEQTQDLERQNHNQNLCPDQHDGPSDSYAKEGNSRSGTNRTSSNDGVAKDGSNIACVSDGTDFFVQDDYINLEGFLGGPQDRETSTSTILPPPDGITTDSNGFFWYIDNQNLGKVSKIFPGAWPTKYNHGEKDGDQYEDNAWDPREPNQCEEHRDPTSDETSGPTGVAAADNVATFAEENSDPQERAENASAWAEDHQDFRKSRSTKLVTCSPVPNMQYIDVDNDETTPQDNFAWPLHLAEDRLTDEEDSETEPTAVTDPWKCDDQGTPGGAEVDGRDTGVKGDPNDWSEDDSDGPITDADEPHKYYYAGHDGPSLWPTYARGKNVIDSHLLGEQCTRKQGGFFLQEPVFGLTVTGGVETYSSGGSQKLGDRDQTPIDMSFVAADCFNPSEAPGTPVGDTAACEPDDPLLAHDSAGGKARNTHHWFGVWYIDVPDEPPDAYSGRTFNHTIYADVSFGNIVENDDGSCDFPFNPAGDENDTWAGQGACFPQASDPFADTGDNCSDYKNDVCAGDGSQDGDNRGGIFDAGPLEPSLRASVDGYGEYLPAGQDNAHTFGDIQCGGATAPSIQGLTVQNDGNDEFVENPSTYDGLNKWSCDRQQWANQLGHGGNCALQHLSDTPRKNVDPDVEQSCFMDLYPGDPYDLWDLTCMDNDAAGGNTTDNSPDNSGTFSTDAIGNRDCDSYSDGGPPLQDPGTIVSNDVINP